MTLPEFYPPADHTSQWKPALAGGGTLAAWTKLVLHTTESSGWPSYPTFAPHLTYDPWSHAWRQHLPLTRSATTLADPASTPVRENRDDVVQVEIVGYADHKQRSDRWASRIDEQAVRELAAFAAWLHREGGLPLRAWSHGLLDGRWQAYPLSYGLHNPNRASSVEYDTFTGILGHQHVSGNDHGDPGDLPIAAILAQAIDDVLPPTPTKPAPTTPSKPTKKPSKPKLVDYRVVAKPGLRGRFKPSVKGATKVPARLRPTGYKPLQLLDESYRRADGYDWGRTKHGTWYAVRQIRAGRVVDTYLKKL